MYIYVLTHESDSNWIRFLPKCSFFGKVKWTGISFTNNLKYSIEWTAYNLILIKNDERKELKYEKYHKYLCSENVKP